MCLFTGLFGSLVTPAIAQDQFDNYNISFSQDTVVEFEFIRSHGSNQSTFGIINFTTGEERVLFREIKPYDAYGNYSRERRIQGQNNTNEFVDYVGTIGNAVLPGPYVNIVPYNSKPNGSVIEFLFRKNQDYAFFLESRNDIGEIKRVLLSNDNYTQFDGELGGGNMRDRYGRDIIGSSISWEDGGERNITDLDFDDFVVEAGGVLRNNCNCQPYYYQPYYYQPQSYHYQPYSYSYYNPYHYPQSYSYQHTYSYPLYYYQPQFSYYQPYYYRPYYSNPN